MPVLNSTVTSSVNNGMAVSLSWTDSTWAGRTSLVECQSLRVDWHTTFKTLFIGWYLYRMPSSLYIISDTVPRLMIRRKYGSRWIFCKFVEVLIRGRETDAESVSLFSSARGDTRKIVVMGLLWFKSYPSISCIHWEKRKTRWPTALKVSGYTILFPIPDQTGVTLKSASRYVSPIASRMI